MKKAACVHALHVEILAKNLKMFEKNFLRKRISIPKSPILQSLIFKTHFWSSGAKFWVEVLEAFTDVKHLAFFRAYYDVIGVGASSKNYVHHACTPCLVDYRLV